VTLWAQCELEVTHIRRIELMPSAIRRALSVALHLHEQALAAFRRALGANDLNLLASIKGCPPSTVHFAVNVEARTARSITWIGPSGKHP
jgi:hypothetical protein